MSQETENCYIKISKSIRDSHSKKEKMPNLFAKTRKVNDPYEIYRAGGWEWRVLKKWQIDDNKPYARWFCAVKSPFTEPGYDMGDTYVSEILSVAQKVEFDPNTIEKWREY